MLVATGIACWFTFQAFENIGMTLGITPVTGLPLPFVSYGGSAMFANMMAIGLLQNVHLKRYVEQVLSLPVQLRPVWCFGLPSVRSLTSLRH